MPITIPKTDLPESYRVRVTLRFEAFSEDGEFATVTDQAGHRSEIPLSSILQGDHDSLIAGDTAACDILREVWAESGLVPDEEPAEAEAPQPEQASPEQASPEQEPDPTRDESATPLSMDGQHIHRRGRDAIEVTLPLTDAERLELAQEMADALAERDRLESEFNAIKKDYKTRIDLQVNLAAQAGETYRAGERTQDVFCDVFEDRTTGHIVWLDSASCVEVKRRLMTYEERQLKLPGMDTYMEESSSKKGRKKKTEETPHAHAPDTHTCLNCGNRDATTDAMPEPCHTCSQVESGDSDNWTPIHECATCTHKTTRVNMPPCNACQCNADKTHRGKGDKWEWAPQPAQALPEQALPEQASPDAEPAHTDEVSAFPGMPCSDDGVPEIDDAMPSLQPIGDSTEVRQ